MDDMPELYLTSGDTCIWLGIPPYQVTALSDALGFEACGGRGTPRRYYKAQLRELKSCVGIMRETGVNTASAVKVHRALQARAAAKSGEATA